MAAKLPILETVEDGFAAAIEARWRARSHARSRSAGHARGAKPELGFEIGLPARRDHDASAGPARPGHQARQPDHAATSDPSRSRCARPSRAAFPHST